MSDRNFMSLMLVIGTLICITCAIMFGTNFPTLIHEYSVSDVRADISQCDEMNYTHGVTGESSDEGNQFRITSVFCVAPNGEVIEADAHLNLKGSK